MQRPSPPILHLQEVMVELQHRGWKDTKPTVVLRFSKHS